MRRVRVSVLRGYSGPNPAVRACSGCYNDVAYPVTGAPADGCDDMMGSVGFPCCAPPTGGLGEERLFLGGGRVRPRHQAALGITCS